MSPNRDHELYRAGLAKTRGSIWGRIRSIFTGVVSLDAAHLEKVEEILVGADVGLAYTTRFIDHLKTLSVGIRTEEELRRVLRTWILEAVAAGIAPGLDAGKGNTADTKVTLVVGVNGTGKTTTAAKLAYREVRSGRTAMLVAADTFRAAAVEQLRIWAGNSGALFHGSIEGGDPAAVVHDAMVRAKAEGVGCVIIDTAGRLHTKEPLMRELEKIVRVASKIVPDAPHETLLVLDATTGQNALVQAREFSRVVGLTGVAITKMDGTAKGGILIPIVGELRLPVKYVGLGEGIEDLVPFDPEEYAKGIVGD